MQAPKNWPQKYQEHFEERAAIRQYLGKRSREEAERGAIDETIEKMKEDKRNERHAKTSG